MQEPRVLLDGPFSVKAAWDHLSTNHKRKALSKGKTVFSTQFSKSELCKTGFRHKVTQI